MVACADVNVVRRQGKDRTHIRNAMGGTPWMWAGENRSVIVGNGCTCRHGDRNRDKDVDEEGGVRKGLVSGIPWAAQL